jgi:hypothetical protein
LAACDLRCDVLVMNDSMTSLAPIDALTLRRGFRIPALTSRAANGVVHLPVAMRRDIEKYARKLGRSVGWCLRMAWCIASSDVGSQSSVASVATSRLLGGSVEPLRVELPLSTWRHVTLEAERLDRSKSWMIGRAWLLARRRFAGAMR